MGRSTKPGVLLVVFGTVVAAFLLRSALAPAGASRLEILSFTPTAWVYLPVVLKPPAPTSTPTATSTPTVTPTPTMTATPTPPTWLSRANLYRSMANLPAVTENPTWSDGDRKHALYLVQNDVVQHTEDPGNQWYTPEGAIAGRSSNVMGSTAINATDEHAVDLWLQGPFHAVGIIDPALSQVGFGSYREAGGWVQMAAALDVLSGRGQIPLSVLFPIQWPADGKTTPLRSYDGGEIPNPLSSCSGYSVPSGLPITLQLGAGNVVPSVTAHSFSQDGLPLDHCVFDQTNYMDASNSSYQQLGRSVLSARSAIVLVPRAPLTPGATYTASITTNGQTFTWSFAASGAVQVAGRDFEAVMR